MTRAQELNLDVFKSRKDGGIRVLPVDLEKVSLILRTDSYKPSHWLQTPAKTEYIYSYGESRGGVYPSVTFFGLQYIALRYLMKPITRADIDYAERRFNKHFGTSKIFNRAGWEIILNEYDGYLPIRIKAVPEGTTVNNRNVLFTIENLDPRLAWVTNYAETLLMKVWYPTTVATISRNIKALILRYLKETGTPEALDYKLHDFGYRGVSSEESAAIGGMAHLTNFKGSDTFIANEAALSFYGEDMASISIFAAEHSTIMSWGNTIDDEEKAFDNAIKKARECELPFYAVVSDTHNIFDACNILWGQRLKQAVLDTPGTLVIRPDSGVPNEIVRQVIEILDRHYGHSTNEKGYKVLNKVRVIQGDGIDIEEIERILEALKLRGWSADNVAFGMGGALLQKMDRDTQKFAVKASQVTVDGVAHDVFKTPVGDNSKRSKPGRLKLVETEHGLETYNVLDGSLDAARQDILQTVYENGFLYNLTTFAEVRGRAVKGL